MFSGNKPRTSLVIRCHFGSDGREKARPKVDAHYYANKGHGFEKRENQIDSIRRSVEWFDKYLKGSN
jgi:Prolyl oligopeptidase family